MSHPTENSEEKYVALIHTFGRFNQTSFKEKKHTKTLLQSIKCFLHLLFQSGQHEK